VQAVHKSSFGLQVQADLSATAPPPHRPLAPQVGVKLVKLVKLAVKWTSVLAEPPPAPPGGGSVFCCGAAAE
jgi:hypothetical protein